MYVYFKMYCVLWEVHIIVSYAKFVRIFTQDTHQNELSLIQIFIISLVASTIDVESVEFLVAQFSWISCRGTSHPLINLHTKLENLI